MTIRYIKLGQSGEWEERCITQDQTIRLGYHSPLHQACLNGDWDDVLVHWTRKRNGNAGAAKRDLNQIRDFYTAPDDDIWITFYQRRLYWCRVGHEIIEDGPEGDRFRQVDGRWSCEDLKGKLLSIDNIDGRVTKTQGFRGTICEVRQEMQPYLERKIRGEEQPDVLAARKAERELQTTVESLITGLWWKDFELLVDLIFSRLGWQRVSLLGKTEKDIDLDVMSPITKKRACVQVKSSTSVEEIAECFNKMGQYEQYDEKYFVYHTLAGNPDSIESFGDEYVAWGAADVADLVFQAGLTSWLIQKRS